MRTILRCGLISGVAIGTWWLLVVAMGRYTSWTLGVWMILAMELIAAVWSLRLTVRDGRGYWRQVLAGTLVFAVIAGVLFVSTYIGWAWIAPEYADAFVERARSRALAGGHPPADLDDRLENLRAMYTPIRQATFVVPGTLVTGLALSLIVAVFVRRKRAPSPA